MNFFSGMFALAGLVAAAGPVLIHLLNRRRHRVVEWAAMDFLREALARHRRVLHLRDVLLLLLRTACVLLFALAMARPYFAASGNVADPDQPLHAVLLIDNSLSMSYAELNHTLLDQAKAKARDLIERLPAGSRVTVLPLCSAGAQHSTDTYRNKTDAQEALDAIQVVDRSASVRQALEMAEQACQQVVDIPNKRVILLSDQQPANWPADIAAAAEKLPELQVADVSAVSTDNAWVSSFTLQDGVADVETPAVFLATVQYQGKLPRADVQATLTVDGVAVATRAIDLQPGQSRELSFPFRFDTISVAAGQTQLLTASVALSADALPLDDARVLVVPVVAALPVVFIDQHGSQENARLNRFGETYRLRRLLAPITDRGEVARQLIQVHHHRPEEVTEETLHDARLVVVAGVQDPGNLVPLLREYVDQGGQLLIAAGGAFDPLAWTASAWLDGGGILPAPLLPEPWGELPSEATDELKPLTFAVDGMLGHPYFGLDQVANEELADLYRAPLFFRAVVPDLRPEVLTTLRDYERQRLTARHDALSSASQQQQSMAAALSSSPTPPQPTTPLSPNWLSWGAPPIAVNDPATAAASVERALPSTLATLNNQVPILLERTIDHGSILFFGSGVLTDWNTLTQTNAVLMFDRIFRAMLERTLPRRNLDSVEQIFLPLAAAQRGNRFLLIRPDPLMDGLLATARDLGDAEPLAVESIGNDQSGITARNIAQRGIYQLLSLPPESGETPAQTAPLWEIPFAVNGPATESELLPLNEADISERLAGVAYRWIPRDEPLSLDGARLRGQNLWKWLMALALLTLLLEMLLLAWPALRRERAA